jgi:hypothetical protein
MSKAQFDDVNVTAVGDATDKDRKVFEKERDDIQKFIKKLSGNDIKSGG